MKKILFEILEKNRFMFSIAKYLANKYHFVKLRGKPTEDIFQNIYKSLADSWSIFDTSEKNPVIIEESE